MKTILILLTAFYAFLTPLQAAMPHEISGEQNSFYVWSAEDSTIINGSEDFTVNSKFPSGWGEMRARLWDNGIGFQLIFAGDAFSMVSGGKHSKNDFLFRADLKMTFDFEKLFG